MSDMERTLQTELGSCRLNLRPIDPNIWTIPNLSPSDQLRVCLGELIFIGLFCLKNKLCASTVVHRNGEAL